MRRNQSIWNSMIVSMRDTAWIFICCIWMGNDMFAQQPYVMVLGIAQDGGYPHLGCEENCCRLAWKHKERKQSVVSLALVDPVDKRWWLVEATPDIQLQLKRFQKETKGEYPYLPAGILITHAHIGHYTGLMQLGREVMNSKMLPVYVLPRLKSFLETNGPWSQLVSLNNIQLVELSTANPLALNALIRCRSFTVPHRDEFSETAGFEFNLKSRTYLFIPDIDKWQRWEQDVIDAVRIADIAFLDGTFYRDGELRNRSMSEVPHPFIEETISLFERETEACRSKIHFIHLNHTNPLLWKGKEKKALQKRGFRLAEEGKRY